jgi:ubiquitin thioesterase protein OTUB1
MSSTPTPTTEEEEEATKMMTDQQQDDTDKITDMSYADQVTHTTNQLNEINQSIQQSQPLTSHLLELDTLKASYQDTNPYFIKGIEYLSIKYSKYRTTRGDGDCFYRCVFYRLCELLKTHETITEPIYSFLKNDSMKFAADAGFDETSVEIFYDATVDCLDKVRNEDVDYIYCLLTDEQTAISSYCIWYLRVLTSAYCKTHSDRFLPYVLSEEDTGELCFDVPTFCSRNIEPVGSEATMVAIVALAECLGLCFEIEYLDGHPFTEKLVQHTINESDGDGSGGGGGGDGTFVSKPKISLLYRPGHYDILYS